MKKTLLFTFLILLGINGYTQEKVDNIKVGLGTSLFNLNESFNNVFFLNNSSPIYVSILYKDMFRVESIVNLTVTNSSDFGILSSRGSIALGVDWFHPLYEKTAIYYGPRIGFNSNQTKLVNAHIGGEYDFYKNWTISTEIGFNYVMEYVNYLQTTSSVILRFYF